MKYITQYVAVVAILFAAINANAQDNKSEKKDQKAKSHTGWDHDIPETVPKAYRMAAMSTYEPGIRISQVMGLPVKNLSGKEIGSVQDLVMDKNGQIRYAAMSRGGVLGFGDKLFAIPACCLKVKTSNDGNAKSMFVLFNVSEEKLANSPGFDQNDWPEIGTTEYWVTVDKHFEDEITREMAKKMEKKSFKETSDRKPNSDLEFKSKKVRYPNSGGIPKDAKRSDKSDK